MRSSLLLAIIFVPLFALYIFKGTTTLDPDFGWHIRAGENILMHGIPYKDPFSYTMSSFLFVDHEWLTNLIWAILLPIVGYEPFVIFYALCAVGAIVLQCLLTNKKWLLLPIILVGGTLVDFVGVRTQVIDWLFISVLMFVFWKKGIWEKWSLVLPVMFLLWANLHGGFGIGIGILAVMLGMKSIEERKSLGKNVFVFIFCLLVTLINPFGIRLWREFLSQLTDSQLHWTIDEWSPAIYFTNLAFWIYATISIFLLMRYHKRFPRSIFVMYALCFAAGMTSIRNIPIFAVISIYPTVKGIEYLYAEAEKFVYGKKRFGKGYAVFIVVALVFFLPQLCLFLYSVSLTPNKEASYPASAVVYLKNHLPTGNIMTSYGWGGYVLWQLPEKKDFIDGRMPSWRNAKAPMNESAYAFGEYQAILRQQEPFSFAASKYDIDTILVSVNELDQQQNKIFGIDVETSPVLKFFFGSQLTFAKVVSQVRRMEWKEVYHDRVAVVFEKP